MLRLDHILLETTGLANPAPLASVLWLDDQLESDVRLDSIITVSFFSWSWIIELLAVNSDFVLFRLLMPKIFAISSNHIMTHRHFLKHIIRFHLRYLLYCLCVFLYD